MTIWPEYDGSVNTSWYPVSAVLKTTSPERSAGAPKLLPSKTVPSSKARIAESNSSSSWVWGQCHCIGWAAAGTERTGGASLPQHRLNLTFEPQGQGALLGTGGQPGGAD